MGFFAPFIGIPAEAPLLAWALLGGALLLAFITFLFDGRTAKYQEVHPVAVAGVLLSFLVTLGALFALLVPYFVHHPPTISGSIAGFLYAALLVVALRYVIKGGSLLGGAWQKKVKS